VWKVRTFALAVSDPYIAPIAKFLPRPSMFTCVHPCASLAFDSANATLSESKRPALDASASVPALESTSVGDPTRPVPTSADASLSSAVKLETDWVASLAGRSNAEVCVPV